ncbi:MAG: dTDP-4-dehydrorhamnose reductase [Bacteroidales bacterium]|nr:MAG: dTDP-4-dehydrorhamnose reductase [Bacteroidales bacterium]
MNNILITGSKGQLGSEIEILSNKYKKFRFLFHDIDTLDLTDYSRVEEFIKNNKPLFAVNCAAYTAVDKAETNKELAFRLNAEVPGKLAGLCQKYGARLIHISTDYVFDGKNYRPYKESDVPNPLSVYAQSKFDGENRILEFNNSIIIRTSWLYSVRGNNFVKTILKIGKKKEEIRVVYDQVGSPTYAADLADAVLKIINSAVSSENNFIPGIYHYSNEGVCSWYDLAVEAFRIADIDCKVRPIESKDYPVPAKRPLYSVMNKNKIKSTFKLEIPHWKASLDKFFETYNSI